MKFIDINQRLNYMYDSKDYMSMYKEALHLKSDYSTAKRLEVTRQMMTKIKNGSPLSKDLAYKIAKAIKHDPIEIIATTMAEREKNLDIKAVWIKLAKEKGNDGD